MDSKIGLLVQLSGVILITVLTLSLRRSLKVTALRYWSNAWIFLAAALFSLRVAFGLGTRAEPLFSIYFLCEYVFGLLLVAGCRSLDGKYRLVRSDELKILPFIAVAIALPLVDINFNLVFNIHSFLLASFFAVAFHSLKRARARTFGWYVMRLALALLVVDFFQYFVVFSLRQIWGLEAEYLAYNSVIDLVLEILLGFGMVIALQEQVLDEFQKANEKLTRAHERLEKLVHVDPLTAAFNRHAFYGYLKKRGEENTVVSGCVGFFDIDDLKKINDAHGHIAGDRVIRVVARSIRKVIRAEDLVYRWGGDEFFVIMVSMSTQCVNDRMKRLDDLLKDVQIHGLARPLDIGVSYGFTDFDNLEDLERAVKEADAAMYERKQQR
ncbi:MAG TPA: GGDEF domain-containing protein, partial [Pyrinomonadaceae bacterium]|nr:GGDEF domain-containing protein [Pyrinomonadaceae bacterium]